MREELIIDNQRVDLDGTTITLEWAGGVLQDLGRIELARSYTIKLPTSAQNCRIFDDPGNPAHASSKVRRYLSARYYRDGIDLLGEAQAYLIGVTADSYEIALVWNALPALQELGSSTATLQDLPNLPVLTWIGSNGTTPDYGSGKDGAIFAKYDAGLGTDSYPDVNAATHPAMGLLPLIDCIMTNAGVPYYIASERVRSALSSLYLLAAPSHRPNREMEELSGSDCYSISVGGTSGRLRGSVSRAGWDAPMTGSNVLMFALAGSSKAVHFDLKLRAPLSTSMYPDACVIITSNTTELARVPFVKTDYGYDVVADLEVEIDQWGSVYISSAGVPVGTSFTAAVSGYTPITMWRVHEHIILDADNRFPMAENLPELKQWDLVKACFVLVGAVPVIQNGQLVIMDYNFDLTNAYDWTNSLTETTKISQRLADWAQKNLITYKDDDSQTVMDPTATIRMADETATAERKMFDLPFAASKYSAAVHYGRDKNGEIIDLKIEPRVLKLLGNSLTFSTDMRGDGLIAAYYSELQRIVETPVLVEAVVRLNDLDLAMLDLRRPVYLQQLGHYYAIKKVQADQTGLCKVELLQLT